MKNYLVIGSVIFLFFPGLTQAQVEDNFADGDFTNNPTWTGTASAFKVNGNQELQLNNSSAGSSYLSTPFSAVAIDNYEWSVWIKLSFAPSANNYARIYLISDHSDLTQPLNGYYLQLGEAGNNDAIELFRQAGSSATSVCRAATGGIASAFAIRIRVKRDAGGLWQLLVDHSGGSSFVQEATGIDQTIVQSSFFGVSCLYTVSNDTKFFFDDFSIVAPTNGSGSNIPVDVTPPRLEAQEILSDQTLTLSFSESLERTSA